MGEARIHFSEGNKRGQNSPFLSFHLSLCCLIPLGDKRVSSVLRIPPQEYRTSIETVDKGINNILSILLAIIHCLESNLILKGILQTRISQYISRQKEDIRCVRASHLPVSCLYRGFFFSSLSGSPLNILTVTSFIVASGRPFHTLIILCRKKWSEHYLFLPKG